MRLLAFAPAQSDAKTVVLDIVYAEDPSWAGQLGTVTVYRETGVMWFQPKQGHELTFSPEDIAEVQRFRDPSYE